MTLNERSGLMDGGDGRFWGWLLDWVRGIPSFHLIFFGLDIVDFSVVLPYLI